MSKEKTNYDREYQRITNEIDNPKSFIGELASVLNVPSNIMREFVTGDTERQAQEDAYNRTYNPPN